MKYSQEQIHRDILLKTINAYDGVIQFSEGLKSKSIAELLILNEVFPLMENALKIELIKRGYLDE